MAAYIVSLHPPSWCYEVMTEFPLGCPVAHYHSCARASLSYRCSKTPFTVSEGSCLYLPAHLYFISVVSLETPIMA